MALYKLTKGTLSLIRKTKEDCKDLMAKGFELIGEVDEDYNLIDNRVDQIKEDDPDEKMKEELVKYAHELGLGAPSQLKRLSIETLADRIEEAEKEAD